MPARLKNQRSVILSFIKLYRHFWYTYFFLCLSIAADSFQLRCKPLRKIGGGNKNPLNAFTMEYREEGMCAGCTRPSPILLSNPITSLASERASLPYAGHLGLACSSLTPVRVISCTPCLLLSSPLRALFHLDRPDIWPFFGCYAADERRQSR